MAIDLETIGYLNGIQLEMETIEDSFSVAVAEYDYPYVDGADLENMGQKSRSVKVRCYFADEGIQETYDDHKRLINALAGKGLQELWHPKYGPLHGLIRDVTVRADDRIRCAEIDFTFVEQRREQILVQDRGDVADSAEQFFLASQDEQAASLTSAVITVFGSNPPLPVDVAAPSLLSQINAATGKARQFTREIQDRLARFDAIATDVMQPVNSLVATINYTADLPGRILGTITRSVERVALLYTSLYNFPARLTASLTGAFALLDREFDKLSGTPANKVCRQQLRIACAQRLALETAYSYQADQSRRQQQANRPPAFDLLGRYTPAETTDPVANVRELEASLADVRTYIEAVITDNREMSELKPAARLLLEHVYSVKLERERMVTINVDPAMPLHIICLQRDIPYTDAERLITVNRFPWPSQVSGEVTIYV